MEYRLKYKGKEIDDRLDLAGTAIQEHQDISGLATKEELADALQDSDSSFNKALNNKVDKVSGKGLSTNDYTNEDKEKLASLQNYDDTGIKKELTKKIESEVVVDTEPTEDFEFGYDDTEIRQELSELSSEVGKKQDTITDLETIRSGAAKGATALQSVPSTYATKTDVSNAIQSAITNELNADF